MIKESCEALLENLSTTVMLFDNRLRLQGMNGAAERLLETTIRNLRGKHANEVLSGNPRAARLLEKALASGHSYTDHELELVIRPRVTQIVNFTVSPRHEGAELRDLLVEIVPLDRMHWLAREEIRLDQHQLAKQVVRGLAHEIKNPLGGLRGAAQLLERRLTDPDLKQYTRVIVREADRLHALVDRMRGPMQQPIKEELNIHRVTEHVRQLVAAELPSHIRLRTQYDPSLPRVSIDPDLMTQALLNVVRNAADALLENGKDGVGGVILMRTRSTRQSIIGQNRHRLLLKLEVEDNGPGIDPELKERIFYPMVTGRSEGTGMGLAIVNDIVNQHGGRIEFDSQPGKTLFRILLPI